MKHGSLFSGIGGFGLAAEWIGWENVFQVENDKFCNKILEKNFPKVKRYGDIKEFKGQPRQCDILTGGFPCQPFSVAGKQKGEEDDRNLWPEMLRVIREIQPDWVIGENVPGIIRMELENICTSLESENYKVQPIIIPSASIGAWDKRDRVWIIAYNDKWCGQKYRLQARGEMPNGEITIPSDIKKSRVRELPIQQRGQNKTGNINPDRETKINSNDNCINSNNAGYNSGTISQQQATGIQINNNLTGSGRENSISRNEQEGQTRERNHYFKKSDWWKRDWIEVASELCRSNARVPNRMERIKALGNSVNPYVIFEIFKVIDEIHNS